MREWQPLHTAFGMNSLVGCLLVGIEVHSMSVRNVPTPGDPLGSTPFLKAEWLTPRGLTEGYPIRLCVGLDDSMPFLEPEAAAAYLVVQWPELFRRAVCKP